MLLTADSKLKYVQQLQKAFKNKVTSSLELHGKGFHLFESTTFF